MQKEALIYNTWSGDGQSQRIASEVQSKLRMDIDVFDFHNLLDNPQNVSHYNHIYVLAGDSTFASVYRMLVDKIKTDYPVWLIPFPGGGESAFSRAFGWGEKTDSDEVTDYLNKIAAVREGRKIRVETPLTAYGKREGKAVGSVMSSNYIFPTLPSEFPFLWILDAGFTPDVLKTVDWLGKRGAGNKSRRLVGMTIGAVNNLRQGKLVNYVKNGKMNAAMGAGLIVAGVPYYSARGRIDRQINLSNTNLIMMRIIPERLINDRTRIGAFATFLNDMAAFELGKPAKGGALIFEPISKDANVAFSPPGGLVDLDSLVTYSPQESVIYDSMDRYGNRNGSVLIARRI